MNSRERFYATVERKAVDRPACWLGMPTADALPALCKAYKVADFHELKLQCGDDFYAVEIPYQSPVSSAIYAAFDWYRTGSNVDAEHRTLTTEGCFADCESIEDMEALDFEWPEPEKYIDPDVCRQLIEAAPQDKAVLGVVWASHFQDVCAAFGMENCLVNMLTAPELVHAVNEKILCFYEKALRIFLDAVGDRVDAVLIGNDLGSQRNLIISPALAEEFVLPGAQRLIRLIHSYGAKVIYHSCGSIAELIPMLIEAGADVIHPIQSLAAGMDAHGLKQKFGNAVSFCGGVDTQELLPHGTPGEVRAAVQELRRLFPTGLILSPSHEAIQSDVPPENIKALFEAAREIW